MKRLLLLVTALLPFMAEAQYIAIGTNNTDTTTERYVQFSPTNAVNNRRVIEKIRDSTFWSLRVANAFLWPVDSTHASNNNANNFLWVSPRGHLRRADISSIKPDTLTLYATKYWVQSQGYRATDNVYNAGYGITKTGTEPSATFSVNQADIMTVNRATDSLASVNTKVNGKTNANTILTINGIGQDLSQNRTWSVGDILSTGTYTNPSWVVSLSWGKITGTPTTMSGYGITDGVTNASLISTLSGYATSSSLAAGLAAKESLISAGTTAQYWRGDKTFQTLSTSVVPEGSSLYYTDARSRSAISLTTTGTSGAATYNNSTGVLNIPQYTTPTYTAGAGINISSNVISNAAPDQTVTLTAGRGIIITGAYPNFTISLVTPTINIVSRALNTNFTPNTTKETYVSYSVTCSVTNPLLVGTSTAMAYLEYSTNGGSTWVLPSQNGNSSGVGVTVTLQLTNGQTGTLIGFIPANALVRIRTATTGTASVTYVTGTEMNY